MDITPGEPVPPGFEDEVKKSPHIQSTIDQYKGSALIGIEYTIELHESERQEPGYICILCDKRGDARTILSHWSSFNHRIKYLEKHFPTVVREFQSVKFSPNSHNILIVIVQNLAEAIEEFHGRLQVKKMDADDFRRQKTRHTESIMSGYHCDEKNGPNLLNSLDRTLFEYKLKTPAGESQRKTQKRFNGSPSSGGPSKSNPKKDDFDAISSDSDTPDSSKKTKPNSNQNNFANDDHAEVQGLKLPTPKELSLQASHIAQERYKWEKYRCMLEIQLKQMEKLQSDYEKSPEKHPHYPEEWKKFWNRRYKELQAEKKVDPNKYDYKPEWIVFWTKRMKEFFNAEVEKTKKEIKKKLGLPEEAEEQIEQIKERYKIPVNRVQRAVMVTDVIDISDDETPYNQRSSARPPRRTRSRTRSPRHNRGRDFRRRSHSRSRSRSHSLSPFSDDFEMSNKHHRGHKMHRPPVSRNYSAVDTGGEYYKYPSSSRYQGNGIHGSSHYPPQQTTGAYRILDSSKIPKYEDTNSNSKDSKEEPEEESGPLTVVGVLRLLTALEEQLGSLGPKVVDLLGKALALEKVKANSSDDLLLNEDHTVFFETIKEKLKGLLIADVLDDQLKIRAVKRAIKNIAGVIHQVQKGASNDGGEQDTQTGETDGVTTKSSSAAAHRKATKKANTPSLKDLPFDRQTIATKLAAALVLHGREDVSTEDMDKLIYLFLLMVKLSKAKREVDGKPVYCKNILPELGIIVPSIPVNAMAAIAALPAIVEGLLENEHTASGSKVTAAINDDDYEYEPTVDKELTKSDANSSTLESLTDSDLQTLLQNFKHLSSEEQHHLIAHLKKLELVDPERVEKLRKFVNMSDVDIPGAPSSSKFITADGGKTNLVQSSSSRSNNSSPILLSGRIERRERAPGTEPTRMPVNPNKFSLDDDDDDDYNFDEVFKAASKNVNQFTPDETSRQSMTSNKASKDAAPGGALSTQNDLTFNPSGLKGSLSDTQNLIANLMGSLQQSNSMTKSGSSNSKASTSSILLQPQPVPAPQASSIQPQIQQHHQQPQHQQNLTYFQQQQGYQGTPQSGAYNQMPNAPMNYYNAPMGGGYNQTSYGNNTAYPQWGQPNMQASGYGMPNYGMAQNQMPPTAGYNMYGQGGGN